VIRIEEAKGLVNLRAQRIAPKRIANDGLPAARRCEMRRVAQGVKQDFSVRVLEYLGHSWLSNLTPGFGASSRLPHPSPHPDCSRIAFADPVPFDFDIRLFSSWEQTAVLAKPQGERFGVQGWINHVRYADTWGLREHVLERFAWGPGDGRGCGKTAARRRSRRTGS
jgi:hypothetical protein